LTEITSSANSKYKLWLSLTESKGIKKEGLALLSGPKVVAEFLAAAPERVREILVPPKGQELSADFQHTRLSADLFQALDVIGTHSAVAVIEAPALEKWTPTSTPKGLELILALSDPSNLGSCLRSAEAFGVRQVILTRECASPYLPRALRASSGAALRLALKSTGSLSDLEVSGAIGLDMQGEALNTFTWPRDSYLILGEEGQGLPSSLKVKRLSIPMQPPTESLNATVAAAIAMYAYSAQRKVILA
jgi:TrmH family RNA methyltransferase